MKTPVDLYTPSVELGIGPWLGMDETDSYGKFLNTELCFSYSVEKRYYHNLQHLREMFTFISKYGKNLPEEEIRAIVIAAWYHDAVYDPQRRDNEEQSIALMMDDLSCISCIDDWMFSRVFSHIYATKNHVPKMDDAGRNLFIFSDLAIVASNPERYAEYVAGIRKEYDFMSDDDWHEGRFNVVKRLIFTINALRFGNVCEVDHEIFEKAISNLTGEKEQLLK